MTDAPNPDPRPAEEPPAKPKPGMRKAVLLLYVFLMAAVCFVAYQVRLCVTSANQPTRPARPGGLPLNVGAAPMHEPPDTMPEGSGPADAGGPLPTQPSLGANMTELEGDPADIAPPAGAKPLAGYEQTSPGQVQQQREYLWQGDLKAANEYYLKTLAAAGFQLVAQPTSRNAPPPEDRIVQNFTRDLMHMILVLRKEGSEGKMVRILIVTTNVVPD